MSNPIKDIKENVNQTKQTVNEIKQSVNEVKQEMNSVKANAQHAIGHTRDTSAELKDAMAGVKGAVQESKELYEDTREGFQDLKAAGLAKDAGGEQIAGGKLVKEDNGFVIRGEQGLIGEITYAVGPDTDTWMLDHTFVTPEYRGGDIAKRMLDRVAQEARMEGKKIIPLCSYARIQFQRNPEYHDVWQR